MNSGNFGTDVKEALKRILLKLLGMLGSRKFLAAAFAVTTIILQWQQGSIDAVTAMWGIVTTVGAYAGFTAWEDTASNK